jgi:hypothetical protein
MEVQRYGGYTNLAIASGHHNGADGSATLYDSSKSWSPQSAYIGATVFNRTDGSRAFVVGSNLTGITGTLQSGTQNDWDIGDMFQLTNGYTDDGNYAVSGVGTGQHQGGTSSFVLTDTSKTWTTNAYTGFAVWNLTDGSIATITGNGPSNLSGVLVFGNRNSWENGDIYKITNGYPLRDQPGVGTDNNYWTTNTNGPVQMLQPLYEWGNVRNGQNVDWAVSDPFGVWIQEGRDYFNDTEMPAYVPYTYPHPLRGSLYTYKRLGRHLKFKGLAPV